ncbi:transcriptional coactivator p15/PC4 family protein [Candidatus Pacearchaeota archaeon]|nr:transcriptional coactivator p15/PC4 family protein [Candidatus Pacearchaeota archaeon]
MEKDIGKISKGEYQGTVTDIVVGIKEFNGRVGVDIREFTQSEAYTGPTKKGLRISAEKFEEFKTLINSINSEDLKTESSQESISESPEEDSGIDESGLM